MPLGALGGLLGLLGSFLEASWEPLGDSWGSLGGLLGASWGDVPKKYQKRTPKWTIWGPKMGPRWDPKRTKIEDKNEDEKKTFFKIVLKRSWSHHGPILGHFDLQNRALA